MKKKTQKIIAVSGAVAIVASGLAGGIGMMNTNPNGETPSQESASKKLTVDEQTAIVENISSMAKGGYRPTEIEKALRQNIDQLNKENSTKVIREFMSNIDDTNTYFSNLLYLMNPELQYSMIVDGVKDAVKEKKKISSGLVTGFMDEMNRQHLEVKARDGYYFLESDSNYVLTKYGTYLHGDYKDYMNLTAKEQTDPIYNSEKEMYDIDRVMEDLSYIENGEDRWADGDYAKDFYNLKKNLYQTLFSVNHASFYDLKIKNEGKDNEDYIYTLKDEVRKKYESIISEKSGTSTANDLSEFLKVLKENKYQLNDKVDTFLKELFAKKFNDSSVEKNEIGSVQSADIK